MTEVTFGFVKPDAYNHRAEILEEFIRPSGLSVVASKDPYYFTRRKAREHYVELKNQPFFKPLIDFTVYGLPGLDSPRGGMQRLLSLLSILYGRRKAPTALYVLEGDDAVKILSDMTGPTNPGIASGLTMGGGRETIRSKYGVGLPDNAFHRSDSHQAVRRETMLHFRRDELPEYVWEILDRGPYV